MLKPCVLHVTLKEAAERGELVTLNTVVQSMFAECLNNLPPYVEVKINIPYRHCCQ